MLRGEVRKYTPIHRITPPTAPQVFLAGAVFRFNTFLVGFSPAPGWSYFPSAPEIFITLGIVAVEVMGYLIFVKALPVLPEPEHA